MERWEVRLLHLRQAASNNIKAKAPSGLWPLVVSVTPQVLNSVHRLQAGINNVVE